MRCLGGYRGLFFGMFLTIIFAILYCFHVPSTAKNVPWTTIETAYNAFWTICFLIAGVLLIVVAESAITRPRITYFTSSLIGDKFVLQTSNKETALPPLPDDPGHKREWMLQKTTGNHEEFRPATAGAVFSFAAMVVFAVDTLMTNKERASQAVIRNRNKNGVQV